MINKSASEIELELLLEGIFRLYGYDFRRYARSSLKRRLALIMTKFDLKSYSQLQDKLLHDEASLNEFLCVLPATSCDNHHSCLLN